MERLAQGESIIALSIGDPDFDTPDCITEKLIEAAWRHRTHYSQPSGEHTLKAELARLEARVSGFDRNPEQFTIFNGGTGAIHASLSCIGDPGDNFVVAEPKYLGYEPTCFAIGIELNCVPMTPPKFELDAEALLGAIDERTKGLIVNTPANPTGNIVEPTVLKELALECRNRGLWLLCDEVYSQHCYDGKHTSILNLFQDLENIVVIDSLSKSHAMSGWRVGWAVSSLDFAKRLSDIALGVFFSGSPFIQDAATEALRYSSTQLQKMAARYKERRDYTMRRIESIQGLDAESPAAGMFFMVNVHEDGDVFARQLLDETGVSTFPGSACGECTRNYVRIGLTQPISVLEEAWDRIEHWLKNRRQRLA